MVGRHLHQRCDAGTLRLHINTALGAFVAWQQRQSTVDCFGTDHQGRNRTGARQARAGANGDRLGQPYYWRVDESGLRDAVQCVIPADCRQQPDWRAFSLLPSRVQILRQLPLFGRRALYAGSGALISPRWW